MYISKNKKKNSLIKNSLKKKKKIKKNGKL